MICVCFHIGSFNTIFRLLLLFVILFERKAASPTILNTASIGEQGLLTFTRKTKGNDIIHVGDEPKVITLKKKIILSYSYNFTTLNFLVVQAHTQYRNLSLSTRYGTETNTNSDTAILRIVSYPWRSTTTLIHQLNEAFHTLDYVLRPPSGTNVQALVAVVTSSGKAPIPGGCCLTCSMQMDPNLIITSKQYYKSVLSFPLANVYDYITSDCSGQTRSKPHHYRLQYAIYQYFLEEGNLKNDELFDGISKMLTPAKVKENGKKIRDWNPQVDVPYVEFDTKRGQGMVFNILVFDPMTNAESVYSPVATYGCSFTAKVDGCDSLGIVLCWLTSGSNVDKSLFDTSCYSQYSGSERNRGFHMFCGITTGSIANLVLASCGSLFGLFICFFGLRFYRLYILGSGLTLFSFFGFVLLTIETEWTHDVRMIGSVCIGTAGGLLIYLLWWWTGYRHLVLYICGLPFGFLFSALIFFTPFGNLHYWKNDTNYWTVFFCMSITIPCIFLICLKMFAIMVSSFVGAYGLVVGIDTFLKSSMTYIILNVIMKATVDDFVKYDIPFQSKDYILSGAWGAITILGLIVQFRMTKGKPVLPNEAPRRKRKRKARLRNTQIAEVSRGPIDSRDDRLPILVNSRHENRTIFGNETDEEQLPVLIKSNPRVPRNNDSQQYTTRYGTNVVC